MMEECDDVMDVDDLGCSGHATITLAGTDDGTHLNERTAVMKSKDRKLCSVAGLASILMAHVEP